MTGNLATIGIDIGGTRMRIGRRDAGGRLVAERTASPPDPEEGVAQLVAPGRGARTFVYYTISTGVGTGVILDGRIHHGARDTEGGHQVVWPGGPPCACGGRGCLEAVVSGTGIRARLGRSAEEFDDPAFWDEIAGYLAVAMANTATLLCPEIIALGGGVT